MAYLPQLAGELLPINVTEPRVDDDEEEDETASSKPPTDPKGKGKAV